MARITVRRSPLTMFAPVFGALAVVLVALSVHYTGRLNSEPVPRPPAQVVAANSDRELYENMDVISNMDMLEDMDTIEDMQSL